MGGISPRNDNHAVAVVEELCEHLRAVLRDALCGHLEADLCALADDLLAEASGGRRPRGTRPPRAAIAAGARGLARAGGRAVVGAWGPGGSGIAGRRGRDARERTRVGTRR